MAKSATFQRFLERQRRRLYTRYVYARERVPSQAIAVVLYDRAARHWFAVTQAFPYDAGSWRVAYFDDRGPWSHSTSDFHGRPYWTKYEAILDVLKSYARARIVLYILPEGHRVAVGQALPKDVMMPN